MATRDVSDAGLTELERWFIDRGIPHFIAEYHSSTRVWTRALRFLVPTYLLASLPLGADTWRDAGIEFAAAAETALTDIDARAGAIHVLVNNTGIGVRAAFEDTDQAELRHIFKTNFFDT